MNNKGDNNMTSTNGNHLTTCTALLEGEAQTEYHSGPERCPSCDADNRAALRSEGMDLQATAIMREMERNQQIEDATLDGLYRMEVK